MNAGDPGDAGAGRGAAVVAVQHLSKAFGDVRAVEDLSFEVRPGRVTGFLGPNGAGKTTTLRMLLGLVAPTAGTATIGGLAYRDLPHPQQAVGALLEASDFHPGRRARDHLRVLAATARVPDSRVDEVLALVGLTGAAGRRAGEFSLGMRQRLGLAGALLADPGVLILDEPANGLDPEGIVWLRDLLRSLAARGRTVLVSSHLLSEVQQTVDDVVIIHHGRLVTRSALADLTGTGPSTAVVTPSPEPLIAALRAAGFTVIQPEPDGRLLRVPGATPDVVGGIAFRSGVELHGLSAQVDDLETVFLRLVDGSADRTADERVAAPGVTS